MLVLSRSVDEHGRHRQFFFLIGRFLKFFSSKTALPNDTKFCRTIDASYQVSVQLAEGFQRRGLKCEKLTADGRQVMTNAHVAFGKVSQKSNVAQYNY
jgi:hypothetical protein